MNDQARQSLVVWDININIISSLFSARLKALKATLVCNAINVVGLMMLDLLLSVLAWQVWNCFVCMD